jgi:hypothetical protein
LREIDPFKAFLWAFFAMEILMNKLADCFQVIRGRMDVKIQEETRTLMISVGTASKDVDFTTVTPFLKLALLLIRLNMSAASERMREFQEVKRFRGRLAHANRADEHELQARTNMALSWLEYLLDTAANTLRESGSTLY